MSRPLRLAVLGPSGIGRIHIRLLHELGAEVTAVLSSSRESAERTASELNLTPHWDLDSLLTEDLDAITICTPPARHFEEIVAAFDRDLAVFCEKPLCDAKHVNERLAQLAAHPNRRLFINTSNPVLVDAVADQLPNPQAAKRFAFRFYTPGHYQGQDIAMDLLPHGLSVLLRIFGERPLSDFAWQPTDQACPCQFHYGDCAVEFDFREDPAGPRHLSFSLDEKNFERVQEGQGVTYRVYMRSSQTGERWDSPDPFRVYLSRFLEFCRNGGDDAFPTAAANMKLMAQCIAEGG
ncbi:MAG TPA: Gfo/Idh/MocA family oxidoreductase [Planctomycetes bacterium]|nr:Gfo/Idh/MocA family oxidoreductase [Planctomycetota bacterium]